MSSPTDADTEWCQPATFLNGHWWAWLTWQKLITMCWWDCFPTETLDRKCVRTCLSLFQIASPYTFAFQTETVQSHAVSLLQASWAGRMCHVPAEWERSSWKPPPLHHWEASVFTLGQALQHHFLQSHLVKRKKHLEPARLREVSGRCQIWKNVSAVYTE